MELGPVLVVSFNAQQLSTVRDSKGEIIGEVNSILFIIILYYNSFRITLKMLTISGLCVETRVSLIHQPLGDCSNLG